MATKATKQTTTSSAVAETKYSKSEILLFSTLTGMQKDILTVALSNTKKYTYKEALKEAENFKKGGLF